MAVDLKRITGMRLRAERLARGLTQEHVAEAIGRTVETVSNIERGRAFPGLDTLEQICRLLGIPLASLFDVETGAPLSSRRVELLARLRTLAGTLSDTDLEIAVRQVEALATGRSRPTGS